MLEIAQRHGQLARGTAVRMPAEYGLFGDGDFATAGRHGPPSYGVGLNWEAGLAAARQGRRPGSGLMLAESASRLGTAQRELPVP
jgi:hypothetical protein